MTIQITDLQAHWPPIASMFSIRSEEEYDAAVERLNSLLDKIGTNEQHPLYGVLDTLGTLIHAYEAGHHAVPSASGPEVLQYLMEEHGVSTVQLSDIGPTEVIEQHLAGDQEFSIEQLRMLARRFHVSPAAFIQGYCDYNKPTNSAPFITSYLASSCVAGHSRERIHPRYSLQE